MKRCPACRSQYTDDTLQYCLQDGTPLEAFIQEADDEAWHSEAFEEETVVSERRVPTPPVKSRAGDASSLHIDPKRKSRTGLIVFVTAVGTLLALGILGAGFLILSRGRQDASRNSTNVNVAIAKSPDPTPTVTPTPTASPSPASNSTNADVAPTPNDAEIGREVTKAIAGWQDASESLDTDSLFERYADTVDYYRNPGASREFVIRDKERAFSMYDSIRFQISNMQIMAGKTPDSAIAEFDKAWVFDGDGHSEGKVRSRLSLKKVDGRWLINGERDLKVY
ncbi:MAG: hypothetical protein ABI791_07475 [Acidobacteriota bacterium]